MSIKYKKCTSEIFKKNIEDLCENCPIPAEIRDAIKIKVVDPWAEKKEILSSDVLEAGIRKQMTTAMEAMNKIEALEYKSRNERNDPFRINRIKNYIYNKERAKALKNLLDGKFGSEDWDKKIKIKEIIEASHKNSWEYYFNDEKDFENFISIYSKFFEGNIDSKLKVNLKSGCKSKISKVLREIHRMSGKKLKGDASFFKLVKNINLLENLDDESIYDAMTR